MSELKKLRELTADFLKVLGDSTRLEMIDLLQNGEKTALEIKNALKKSQSTISKHLNLLAENDLIGFEKKGNVKYYRIKNSEIIELINNINAIVLNYNKEKLKEMQEAAIRDTLSP
ncbi:MAG: winged helix-turn-helix transcriptional regulator [Candidatus Lokiarchaeota archaeon]|nr:winged helix-turn-helix transcriptional regulator [Candidatus Lokiarchaeota archaeon]